MALLLKSAEREVVCERIVVVQPGLKCSFAVASAPPLTKERSNANLFSSV